MRILTNLPSTSKEYFEFYKERAFTEFVKEGSLESIIAELRLAYKKYPNSQKRILAMVNVLKAGLNAPLPKENKFNDMVKQTLF